MLQFLGGECLHTGRIRPSVCLSIGTHKLTKERKVCLEPHRNHWCAKKGGETLVVFTIQRYTDPTCQSFFNLQLILPRVYFILTVGRMVEKILDKHKMSAKVGWVGVGMLVCPFSNYHF